MTMLSLLLPLFGAATLRKVFKDLPPLKSPVMDTVFPESQRIAVPSPLLGLSQIASIIQTTPVVSRGADAVPVERAGQTYQWIEPLALNPSDTITAADLNNLRLMSQESKEAWVARVVDKLRRIVRRSTEGIAATSLTGTVSWPLKLEGAGWETYSVDYGAVRSVVVPTLWDAGGAKLTDVWLTLNLMREALEENGYGGSVEIWAGKTAFEKLLRLVEASVTTATIRVEKNDQGVNIAGFQIKHQSVTYKNPQTLATEKIVADKECCMIALDGDHTLFYGAVDDLDAGLRPLPFWVKPIDRNGKRIDVEAQSKPLPVANPKAICRQNVVAGA